MKTKINTFSFFSLLCISLFSFQFFVSSCSSSKIQTFIQVNYFSLLKSKHYSLRPKFRYVVVAEIPGKVSGFFFFNYSFLFFAFLVFFVFLFMFCFSFWEILEFMEVLSLKYDKILKYQYIYIYILKRKWPKKKKTG